MGWNNFLMHQNFRVRTKTFWNSLFSIWKKLVFPCLFLNRTLCSSVSATTKVWRKNNAVNFGFVWMHKTKQNFVTVLKNFTKMNQMSLQSFFLALCKKKTEDWFEKRIKNMSINKQTNSLVYSQVNFFFSSPSFFSCKKKQNVGPEFEKKIPLNCVCFTVNPFETSSKVWGFSF